MDFNAQQYRDMFLNNYLAGKPPMITLLDPAWPINIVPYSGDVGYNVIGIHMLTPEENQAGHLALIDLVKQGTDSQGQPQADKVLGDKMGVWFNDNTPHGQHEILQLDKGGTEPCTNWTLFSGPSDHRLEDMDNATPFDQVHDLNTWVYGNYQQNEGNHLYHFSTYVCYHYGPRVATIPPIDPPPTQPGECVATVGLVLKLTIWGIELVNINNDYEVTKPEDIS